MKKDALRLLVIVLGLAEVVLLADLLLRLLDEVETRIRRLDEHRPASHKGTPINSAD